MKKILILLWAIPCVAWPVHSEINTGIPTDYVQDLKKVAQAVFTMDNVKITTQLTLSATVDGETESEQMTTKSWYSGNKFRFETTDILRVQNEKIQVAVIYDEKTIVLFTPDKSGGIQRKELLKNFTPDSLASIAKSITMINAPEGQKGLHLIFDGPTNYQVDYYYNTTTFLPTRLHWTNKQNDPQTGLDVIFNSDYQFSYSNILANASELDPSHIVRNKNKKWYPVPEYAGYQIQDNRLTKK